MEFYLIYVHFPNMTDFKNNSQSIGSVVCRNCWIKRRLVHVCGNTTPPLWIQNYFLHWKISTFSPSCEENIYKLSQTSCLHRCIHCHYPQFLLRGVLGLLMEPSAYQSPFYTSWFLRLRQYVLLFLASNLRPYSIIVFVTGITILDSTAGVRQQQVQFTLSVAFTAKMSFEVWSFDCSCLNIFKITNWTVPKLQTPKQTYEN